MNFLYMFRMDKLTDKIREECMWFCPVCNKDGIGIKNKEIHFVECFNGRTN